jgi:deoxyhypusine monooxygenase
VLGRAGSTRHRTAGPDKWESAHLFMVGTIDVDESSINRLHRKLIEGGLTLPQKYRVLIGLRNCANASALDALLLALKDNSALFRHDVAFALGQRQDAAAIEALTRLLDDPCEHSMVRHEAAEALGAIGTPECMEPVKRHACSSVAEVRDTCVLAQQRMEFLSSTIDCQEGCSRYQSVDPTPPLPSSVPESELTRLLLEDNIPLFDRYRALFALRDRGGSRAVSSMATCLQTSGSALLKHEIAYVLGQMLDPSSVACLKRVLQVQPSPAFTVVFGADLVINTLTTEATY